MSLQSDGKILIGGDFTTYNDLSTVRVTRLNPDGSKDSSLEIGIGFSSAVYSFQNKATTN